MVSPISVDDGVLNWNGTPLQLLYPLCCTVVIRGVWVDRFVGVTAVLRSAVLLKVVGWIASLLLCVRLVNPRLREFFLFTLYRPRAGIVQHTTSNTYYCYHVPGT